MRQFLGTVTYVRQKLNWEVVEMSLCWPGALAGRTGWCRLDWLVGVGVCTQWVGGEMGHEEDCVQCASWQQLARACDRRYGTGVSAAIGMQIGHPCSSRGRWTISTRVTANKTNVFAREIRRRGAL